MCCLAGSGTPGAPAAVPLGFGVAVVKDDFDVGDFETVELREATGPPEATLFEACDAVDDAPPPLEPPLHPTAAKTANIVAAAPMALVLRTTSTLLWVKPECP